MNRLIVFLLFSTISVFAQNSNSSVLQNERVTVLSNFYLDKVTRTEVISKLLEQKKRTLKNNPAFSIETASYIATVYRLIGKSEEGKQVLINGINDAEKILKGVSRDTIQFKLAADLGAVYRKDNDYEVAKKYFEKCALILQKTPIIKERMPLYLAAFYYNFGALLQSKGDVLASNSFFKACIELDPKLPNRYSKTFALEALARNYIEIGELASAIATLKEAISITERGVDKANRYLKIAEIELLQKRYESCFQNIKAAEKAFKGSLLRKNGMLFPHVEIQILLLKGKYLAALNKKTAAKTAFVAVLKLHQRFFKKEKGNAAAEALFELAKFETNPVPLLTRSLAAAQQNGGLNDMELLSPKFFLEAQIAKARYFAKTNAPQTIEAYKEAAEAARRVRISFSSLDSKMYYAEQVSPLYEEALVHTKTQSKEAFFSFIEYSKATTLTDVLTELQIKPKHLPPSILNEEIKLKVQRNESLMRLNEAETDSIRDVFLNKLNEIDVQMGLLKSKIETIAPAFYDLKFGKKIRTSQELETSLDNQTAVVSYLLSDNVIYASVSIKNKTTAHKIPLQTDFFKTTNEFIQKLRNQPGIMAYHGSENAQKLYKQLIAPLMNDLKGKTRLVICRDGILNYLPFEALEITPNKYFFYEVAISYAYSASVWLDAQTKTKKATALLSFAPFTSQSGLPVLFKDDILVPLPASEQEVNRIGGTIFKDGLATKNKFYEVYQKYGIIHFATHAQVDDASPTKSFVAFHPRDDNFKLFNNELYDLSLKETKLVVLSACETGDGELKKGEGLLSLARGFAYAGCPSVVSTLWNANDMSVARISVYFHENLRMGKAIDVAMQEAKVKFLDSPEGAAANHPYYWANFVVLGNSDPIEEPHNWIWWCILGLLVLLIIVFWVKKRINIKVVEKSK